MLARVVSTPTGVLLGDSCAASDIFEAHLRVGRKFGATQRSGSPADGHHQQGSIRTASVVAKTAPKIERNQV
jgi:hypothetical protein